MVRDAAANQRWLVVGAVLAAMMGIPGAAEAIDYDIVYVRQPRFGDDTNTIWPEVAHPHRAELGADLVLRHPDGSEEVLVVAGNGAVTDPFVSFDGQWIYYAYFYDLRPERLNYQRSDMPMDGSDIFRIHVQTREVQQLTFQEFTPNTGAGIWDEMNPLDPPSNFNRLGYGIVNLAPCPVPGGRVAFTSTRNAFAPPNAFGTPTLQIFVMDEDGRNVEAVAPMTIGCALHPTILRDGRLMFSSLESQGLRDRRIWALWAINPDGRKFLPLVSGFHAAQSFHFMTQMGNEDIVVCDYYNLNNNGFGALYRFPIAPPAGVPRFYSAFPSENPPIEETRYDDQPSSFQMPFTPWGMFSITPMTTGVDRAAPVGVDGTRVGKFTHPSAAPGDDLLVCWSPGPCNDLNRPTPQPYYDGGIYLMPAAAPVYDPDQLVEIVNDPAYNEAWPRAVVPYSAVHGVDEPDELPWLPNDGNAHETLPAGTAYGLVGSSSVYKRESFPGWVTPWNNTFDGLDAFNTSENGQSSNWSTQGADAGKYANSDIWAIRLLAMEPNTYRSYGPNYGMQYRSFANERLRILGEIPLRKTDEQGDPVIDPEGNPDTSFLARIPADTPFAFQTIDRNGMVLNMSQTWHQVRPGEVRTDCGGCHAHSQLPLFFDQTAAGQAGFTPVDLTETTPLVTHDVNGDPALRVEAASVVNVEFYRDIRPILERSCVSCHTSQDPDPPGNLVLDDQSIADGVPGDYARLAADSYAQWGYPPVISNGIWRQTNASRYVRRFQSRRSLLIWKLFGQRLDGWANGDHPTESVPGDANTLPAGADPNDADLDFTGTIMPPPGSGAVPLSEDEKMMFARWVDLGCPINTGQQHGSGEWGWFLDDLRPALTVSLPRRSMVGPLSAFRFGVADAYSGVDLQTLSVSASFVVAGRPAGSELADLAQEVGQGIYEIPLDPPWLRLDDGQLFVEVADAQGNFSRVLRDFDVLSPAGPSDFNGDGQVDLADAQQFIAAMLGPEQTAESPYDLDGDGDADLQDFASVQRAVNGSP